MNVRSLTALLLLVFSGLSPALAEEDFSDPEEKARRAHELAVSDVIYEQENFKALYYQNQRIIELLAEIKEELHAVNVRAAKEQTKT